MLIFNYSLFWIVLFISQLVFLSAISSKIFNHLYGFFHKFIKNDQTVVLIVSFIFLPGTFIHELCHALTAVLLGGRVASFSVWPRIEGDSIKMGFAEVEVLDLIRNSLIGISPLVIGSVTLYFLASIFQNSSIWYQLLYVYLIFQISNSMFLSPSDVKEFRILFFIFIFFLISATIVNLYFVRLPYFPQSTAFLLTNWNLEIFKNISLFMFFPLVLNSILFLMTRFFITHKRY